MEKRNIWDVSEPLELHSDARGRIADIFYKQDINHVAVIESSVGSDRGDHYHKETTQHILITRGALEYWHKPLDSDEEAQCVVVREGEMVSTPPYEVHALRIIENNQFIVMSQGLRGGRDYEIDTFRVEPSIMPKQVKLHLGCGSRHLSGFVHIDLDTHDFIDHQHDFRTLPMFEDDSVDLIYCCGALAYSDREEALDVLAEWRRVLKPGASLRLSLTDFDKTVELFKKNGLDSRGVLGPLFGKWKISEGGEEQFLYQKTVYDFDSLRSVLERVGFTNVRRYDWQRVMPPDYDDHSMAYIPHMDKENGTLICLNVEADKAST